MIDGRRILFVAPASNPGGQAETLLALVAHLPSHGFTPEVVALEDGHLVERLRAGHVTVEVLSGGRFRDPRGFARVVHWLERRLRHQHYAAIVSNEAKAHLYVGPVAAVLRVPAFWFQPRFPDPPSAIDRLATAFPATGIIAVSHASAAAQRRLGRGHLVHVMHPGIEVERFSGASGSSVRQEHNIPAGASVVSLVGRLQPWKGQLEFVRAAALLADARPELCFAIVGGAVLGREGDFSQRVDALVDELGIHDRVTLTGHIPRPAEWMAASNVVVSASLNEPFGLVIVEALAAGCVVVAVDSGGPREIITDGETGLLSPTRQPHDLARTIARALDDTRLREQVKSRGPELVAARFTGEMMCDRFVSILAGDPRD